MTKAETFLIDAVRIYEKEGWHLPAGNTRKEIAKCQKELGNKHKYPSYALKAITYNDGRKNQISDFLFC